MGPDDRTGHERTTTTVEVAEERARVDVVERVTGRVDVRTRTETVDETVDVVLESVGADVERVTIERYLDDGESVPRARREGDTWIVPVLEEVVVVEKRLMLKEELRITQTGDRQDVSVPVTLRRQVVEIDRTPVPAPTHPTTTPDRESNP